ncbi:hypothetical protein [Streptomyces sp. NBC_00271]|uniref:hypothetical protein n=1 Tax=Streptomyces sp. NBC_00271 TaxID=2975697 RepID=UPI002E2B906A|nr:hypothetical protein [Streptomyces sp. NBC_00271]
MISAQSAWATAEQAVPVAALTTIVLGYFLAVLLARRQEMGKHQAAAELALRRVVFALRREVGLANARLAQTGTFGAEKFTGWAIDAFALEAVELARGLSKSKQKRVRSELVLLTGEWRVQMAEDLGQVLETVAERGKGAGLAALALRHVVVRDDDAVQGWYSAYAAAGEDVTEGLLHELSTAQLPTEEVPAVLAALDHLLLAVGGTVGLAGRPVAG